MDTSSSHAVAGEKQGSSGQVGAILRAARQRLGEPLESAAETLRIRQSYLHAIEEGRYGDLPGVAYAIGFVRAYADHLGLHAEEVVRRFKEESQSQTVSNALEFPSPTNEGGLPAGAMVAFALVLAAGAYGAWYWVSTSDKPVAELIPDIPERLASMVRGDQAKEAVQLETLPETRPDRAEETASRPLITPAPEDGAKGEVMASDGAVSEADPMASLGNVQENQAPDGPDTAPEGAEKTTPEDTQQTASEEPQLAMSAEAQPATPEAVETQSTQTATEAGSTAMPRPPQKPTPQSEAAVEETAPAEKSPEPASEAQPAPKPAAVESAPNPTTTEPAAEPTTADPTPKPTAADTAPEAAPAPKPEAAPAPKAEPAPAPEPEPEVAAGTAPPPPSAAEVEETPRIESFVGKAAPAAVAAKAQGSRTVLRATNDTWIQLRKGGDLVVRRLLRAGDIYAVPTTEGLSLNVTNAGALEVYVDGQRAPSLGPAGAVRNNISLSPNRLKSGR